MLRSLAWRATDNLTREQLDMFQTLSDQISLSDDARRRALHLDDNIWKAWLDFLANGPLPAEPALPEMLHRVATTAFRLSTIANAGPHRTP